MKSVAACFARQILSIQPREREIREARRHVLGVRAAISRHLRVPIRRTVSIGSQAKGTGISGTSDVDLLFVIGQEQARWGGSRITSSALLERFKRAISATYPSTAISRQGQAVAVSFAGTNVSLDVVPAIEAGKIRQANSYLMPDGVGGWLTIVPLAELRRFSLANVRSQNKLRRTVQLMKLWKRSRAEEVLLRSYYIELALVSTGLAAGARSYSEILLGAFRLLLLRGATALRDPDGRVGLTHPIPPRASPERVMEAVRAARDLASTARSHEILGDHERAAASWRRLFNGKFPCP